MSGMADNFKMQYAVNIGNYGNNYFILIKSCAEKRKLVNCREIISECRDYLIKMKGLINLLKNSGIDTDYYNTEQGLKDIDCLEKRLKC